MKELYIMCGVPGSGKSTYIRENASRGSSAVISRDKIRFSMVEPTEAYFSKEKEVYNEYVRQINQALQSPWVDEVWCDATHISKSARTQLVSAITMNRNNYRIHVIVIDPPIEKVIIQNAHRTGRECVPTSAITRMKDQFEDPAFDGITYEEINYYE